MTTEGPSPTEIWEYFSKHVVPSIKKWQMEGVPSGQTVTHPDGLVLEFLQDILPNQERLP